MYSPVKQRGRRKDILNEYRVLCDQGRNCTSFVVPISGEHLEIRLEKQMFRLPWRSDTKSTLQSTPMIVNTTRRKLLHDSNQV